MGAEKNEVKLYNVLFPFWMILMFPIAWVVVLPANFIIDSLVLIISMKILHLADKKRFYLRHIFVVFAFGMLSDVIAGIFVFLMMYVFELGNMGDELYLTIPGIIIAAALIFVLNYFVTFRKVEKPLRFKMAMIFATVTAPYTFLVQSSWIY